MESVASLNFPGNHSKKNTEPTSENVCLGVSRISATPAASPDPAALVRLRGEALLAILPRDARRNMTNCND